MLDRTLSRIMGAVLLVGLSCGVCAGAQSLSVRDRVAWEEALLAFEDGDWQEALTLLEDVTGSAGPVPAVLYDAAWIAYESGEFLRGEDYIQTVLATDDAEYRDSDQYQDAFRLAAAIQRSLRPIRDSLVDATPLPYTDSLARTGFGRELRDRVADCEWRFDRGGLIAKAGDDATCMNGSAAATGRIRIAVTLEKRGGGSKSSAGIVFGREADQTYYFLRIHPRWDDMGGDMSLVGLRDGQEVFRSVTMALDGQNRPLRSWNERGPWRLVLEIRGRRLDWYLDGRPMGTEYLDTEVRGGVMAAVSGEDDGEYLFTGFSMDRLAEEEASR
jgi:hypothetical protein